MVDTPEMPAELLKQLEEYSRSEEDVSVDPQSPPAGIANDFLQIASGAGAIVEPQIEWAGEGGILNNGFPTGIVLQEQYNKAWRQATAWIRALGWHSSQMIGQGAVDDGNSEKLWRQFYESSLVAPTVADPTNTNNYATPINYNLTWTSPPKSGTAILLWVGHANTATNPTLNFMSTGIWPIKHLDNTLPYVGDIAGFVPLVFIANGASSAWYVISINIYMLKNRIGNIIVVTSATTVYISPTGSDTTGIGTLASPWATLQYAYNQITSRFFNVGGYSITIQMADGTYTAGLVAQSAPLGSSQVIIRGNPASPSAVRVVASGGNPCFYILNNGNIKIDGVSVNSVGVSGIGVSTQYGGYALITNMIFETCGFAHLNATFGSSINCIGAITITGSSQAFYYATSGATITAGSQGGSAVVTLSGSPTFTIAFVISSGGTFIYAPVGLVTFSGAAIGPKYQGSALGIIETQGAGTSFFPGSTAGSLASGAIYL